MTISIQKVPYTTELARLANSTKQSLKITSPYITFKGIEYIKHTDVKPKIITRVTASNLSSNALDGKALKHLLVLGAEIRSIPNLHAKLYLIDDNQGIITSSNLTASGFSKNVELGVYFKDEQDLFKSVDYFFSRLWEKAHPVTLESLEQFEKQIKNIKFNNGIYRLETDKEEEEIAPVPAIGNLVFDVEEDEQQNNEININEDFDDLEPDEIGDFFAPLPLTVDSLINSLSSSNEKNVQAVINSLSLTSNEDFVNWVEKLGSINLLVSPMNSYPYKRHVTRRIIKHGTVFHLLRAVESLVSDFSNESQIVIYFDLLVDRVKEFSINEKKSLKEGLDSTKEYLSKKMNVRIYGNKNFVKPNLDRINRLINLCEEIKKEKEVLRQQTSSFVNEDTIPSFQNIKRKREALGDDFWDYSVQFFPKIASGEWNNHLSAVNSLFKELGKIHLKQEQKRVLEDFSEGIIKQIQFATKKVLKEVEEYLTNLAAKERFNELEKEQLYKAINELEKSTGRLVQLYGQWIKSNRFERDIEFKKKMDYLSTSYSTQKTIKQYLK
ncbi:phospholipase D-like domain-containing protein [Bacillus paranthracis]|uniref:phospholipase D family protein n=1 Tax=Bacillus paranthracis TaxID=2026186 RepID=UPI000789DDD3|nr:phospholipase D-like domain-containing protein [Bacillus paranthracis]KYQ01860.1 hypothetical protein B4079_3142 [Bacillus cereus]MDK7473350.1 phospholipase D-like domain-containing protein [Bacillus paranthracis]